MANQLQLRVHLLGRFQVALEHEPISQSAWRLRSAAALLKLLALAPDHRLHREQLMELLWPEAEPEAAANNLRYSLHAARRGLSASGGVGDYFHRDGSMLLLGPAELIWTDVRAFEDGVAAAWQGAEAEPYQQAAALYIGDLLPEDLYEEWAQDRRTALRASYLALLDRLAGLHEQHGELEQAITTLQQLVAWEPTQESAHLRLMRLYAQTGSRRQALDQYARLAEILERELAVTPDAQARELLVAIQEGRFPDQAAPLDSAVATNGAMKRAMPPTGVPTPLDALIGRRREIAEVSQLLTTTRLVTLTGPGGIGKTRLAIAVAHALEDALPDGAIFVSLATAQNPTMIVARVAQTLDLREQAGQSLEELVQFHLRAKRLLIVLDNCEHVLTGAPLLTGLLEHCPQVRVLATSRVRLAVAGEQEYPVGPLRYPDSSIEMPTGLLASYPAVMLFERRAREVQAGFALTEENSPAVAEIVHRLHGLPLAIGLAAARSKLLTPRMMLERLDHPLDLLTGGPRDAPERQRTMRNTINWSYDLLQPDERQLFHMMSVFAGGWTLTMAEPIAAQDGCGATEVLDCLTALADSNLVTHENHPDREPRFSMLETVREFGLERLAAEGQSEDLHERHARYFAALAAPTVEVIGGPEPHIWLDRLEAERDNFRSALRWAISAGQGELAQRISGSLWEFWGVRGSMAEGRRWLELALEADRRDTAARAEALLGAGNMAWRTAEYDAAGAHFEAGLALFRRLGDDRGIVRTLNCRGLLEMARGRLDVAQADLEESVALARHIGDLHAIARVLNNLGGNAIRRGDYEQAREVLEECASVSRRIDSPRSLAYALSNLGVLAHDQGDLEHARIWLEESRDLFDSHGDRSQVAQLTCHLGQVALAEGDIQLARHTFGESLELSREVGNRLLIANVLRHLGQLSLATAAPRRSAQLFGAAEQLREQVSWNRASAFEREEYEAALSRLMTLLNAEGLSAAWAEGRAMSMDDAISYALSDEHDTLNDLLSDVAM